MKIVDMHCDTISEIWESQRANKPQQLYQNSLHVDIQKMQKAGYLLQNFALYIDLQKGLDPFVHVLELIHVFQDEIQKNEKYIRLAKTYDEIIANNQEGKISALMTIEEGECCKGEIKNLETLYDLGARMMTLTWNYPNALGSPNILLKDAVVSAGGFYRFDSSVGLTEKGFLFVERMEELGMIIDVSHLSDAGFWDVAKHTKKPFVASHSNARALCGHARNLTDDMIRAIADKGGVIGLNCYGCFLNAINDDRSYVAKMVEHARHILNVGGRECLGLGTDFDGIKGTLEMQDCSQMYKLVREFERQQFTDSEIENVLFRNVLRVYKEVM